jgi:hypothetical protein
MCYRSRVSLTSAQVMSGLRFGASARDPLKILGLVVVLGALAVTANYVPARRAFKTDPRRLCDTREEK